MRPHLGGHPVCLLGFESKPLPRLGWVPVYGPDHWTGGTLFPLASKKVARAVNAASGNRPLVVLANLSGFDGSPESLRSSAAVGYQRVLHQVVRREFRLLADLTAWAPADDAEPKPRRARKPRADRAGSDAVLQGLH